MFRVGLLLACLALAGCKTLEPEVAQLVADPTRSPAVLPVDVTQSCFKVAQFRNPARATSSSFNPSATVKFSRKLSGRRAKAAQRVADRPRVYDIRYTLEERSVLQSERGRLACVVKMEEDVAEAVVAFPVDYRGKVDRVRYETSVNQFYLELDGRGHHITTLGF